MGGRARQGGDVRGQRWRAAGWLALACALVALGLTLRLVHPGSDPPLTLSRSNAEITDAAWYLDDAVRRVRRLPDDPYDRRHFGHYRKPIVTWSALWVFGDRADYPRAQRWAALWGAGLVAAGMGFAWTAWGASAGLFAGLLLACGFVFVGYGRTPVVYGPLATALALLAWLRVAAGRSPVLRAAVAVGLVGLALGLKENAVVVLPALALLEWLESRPSWRVGLLVASALVVAGLGVYALEPRLVRLTWAKATAYLGGGGPFEVAKRWLRCPFASGLTLRSPLVAALGWCGIGAVFVLRRSWRASPASRAAVLAAGWAAGWFAVHALFEYLEGGPPPMRHLLGALVPAALLSAWVLSRLVRGLPSGAFALRPLPFVLWVWLGAYWLVGTGWSAVWPRLSASLRASGALRWWVSFAGIAVTAAVLAVLAAVWARRRGWSVALRPGRRPWLVALLVVAALGVDAWWLAGPIARPGWSLLRANAELASWLAPGARLYGPWAHALTWSAPRIERHLPPHRIRAILERSTRMTHLVIDRGWTRDLLRQYEHNGIRLERLALLRVRGHPIVLFRYPWAQRLGYRLSERERAAQTAR
ncbi:MAG: hypothetical protein D6776_07535 [Planctomycetota bacterium]|nr:MAG: hypothetical protein D6776_07535 [Planctomycetota bacterium]